MICPNCGSDRTRRGGNQIWTIYLLLLALAVPAVTYFKLNAAIIGGVLVACIVITHLLFEERVCLDCGQQFSGKK